MPEFGEWRDIQDIPKDGTLWLLWSPDEGFAIGGWTDGRVVDDNTLREFSASDFSLLPKPPDGR